MLVMKLLWYANYAEQYHLMHLLGAIISKEAAEFICRLFTYIKPQIKQVV